MALAEALSTHQQVISGKQSACRAHFISSDD